MGTIPYVLVLVLWVRDRGQKRGKGGMEMRGKRLGKADKWKADREGV